MILLLSTSDTDLLSARAAANSDGVSYRWANPSRLLDEDLPSLSDGVDVAIIRLLGGRRAWESGIEFFRESGIPTVLVSGEQAPDAELTEYSTVPANVATTSHTYLAEGGPQNLIELHNFLSDTLLLTGHGFREPKRMPEWGLLERNAQQKATTAHVPAQAAEPARAGSATPSVGIIYYRAQHLAGNTGYIHALCDAIEARGCVVKPIFAASLRTASQDLLTELATCDALITTVLAAGGKRPALAQAGGEDDQWDIAALAKLNIPIIQGLALTSSRAAWADNDEGLTPLDVATQVAVPEFDGRLISVPFSFKEIDDDDLITYVADPERCARLAGIAARHAKLRYIPAADKRVVLMLSAYPTKHARIGNAVGLDTPASTLRVMHALAEAGYDLGDTSKIPGFATGENGADQPDDFMHAIIEAGGQDPDWLTEEVMAANELKLPAAKYQTFFNTLPEQLRVEMTDKWGAAPGALYVNEDTNEIYIAGLRFGNVVVMVQPPRGFGDNPVGIYHDPDLPPTHHYLACYHWIALEQTAGGFGADAIVHMGKHGNMEWLPGKTVGLSAECGPDQAIGELPLIYPFLVNDPGEGTQAKRRAHATLVDHLIPPMARAESYGDITRLEQLLDEHQNISAMDPAKLPAIRQEIWTLLTAAKMDRDLGWEERPDEDVFDDMLMHVDGWLCEIKDVAIRGGLHILGAAPQGEQLIGTVTTMLRARQLWGGQQTLPGLREALGLAEDGTDNRTSVDNIDAIATALVTAVVENSDQEIAELVADVLSAPACAGIDRAGIDDHKVIALLEFTRGEILPRLAQTSEEIPRILHALDGGFVPAGPSGSPLRGLVNVLPTGRNFYSVDPKAIPSRLAWETGVNLADGLIERYRADHDGEYPKSVGLSVWGTSAMRTSGDDIAEVLALLGVRPVWDEASRRIVGLEVIDVAELGRPRIDVTVRISGFFRDAFPHVIDLLDDAVQKVAALDEPAEHNFVRAHAQADKQPVPRRIFGSKPGTYGAGLLQLIDSGSWRDDADLAEVYTTWGGYAYGRGVDGIEAAEDMKTAYRRIQVAAKNADTREHDIADSDDYFQFHGGMVATVRALTGKDPEAYIGDSTRPDSVRTRSLHEETRRVFRARVVNPRWMQAMRNHGYKGAFEMSATVDYLFGYDATAGVLDDWMYETLTDEYVANAENREFFEASNPWALHDISERLLEAIERKMWENPDQERLDLLRQTFLDTEGELEERSK